MKYYLNGNKIIIINLSGKYAQKYNNINIFVKTIVSYILRKKVLILYLLNLKILFMKLIKCTFIFLLFSIFSLTSNAQSWITWNDVFSSSQITGNVTLGAETVNANVVVTTNFAAIGTYANNTQAYNNTIFRGNRYSTITTQPLGNYESNLEVGNSLQWFWSRHHVNYKPSIVTFTFDKNIVLNTLAISDLDAGPTWNDSYAISGYTFNSIVHGNWSSLNVSPVVTNNSVSMSDITVQDTTVAISGDGFARHHGNITLPAGTPVIVTFTGIKPVSADRHYSNRDQGWAVKVSLPTIVAEDDERTINTGSSDITSVLLNDEHNGAVAGSNVVLSQVSTSHPGVTLNTSTGIVDVAPGTPAGIHTIVYRITDNAVSSLYAEATITVTVSTTTPVDILSFEGKVQNANINLEWKTGTELNFNKFEIEKKTERDFVKVGEVLAKGNNSTYLFTTTQQEATAIYRLKAIDKDGSEKYSKEIVINKKADGAFKVYPNPVAGKTVKIQTAKADVVTLFNSSGVLVKTISLQPGVNTISLSGLSSGVYFIKSKETQHSEKILVK